MINRHSIILFFALLGSWCQAQGNNVSDQYINRFKEIAIREMERTGVPASIKLAQGILESGWGRSDLAAQANNHFGIKCGSSWTGKTYYKKDDDFDDRGQLIESCFRSYRDPEESYMAHSDFFRESGRQGRYAFLFSLDPTDYKAWAKGLRQAGYATSATYSSRLIDIIERYDLHQYDKLRSTDLIAGGDKPDVSTPTDRPEPPTTTTPSAPTGVVFKNNNVEYVLAGSGETLQRLAVRTGTRVMDLVKYNENEYTANQALKEGTVVYLSSKRNSFNGDRQWHYVKAGENIFIISQLYGIDLDRLYRRNKLEPGQEPAVGEQLKIRGWSVSSPPRLKSQAPSGGTGLKPIDIPSPAPPRNEEPKPRPIEVEDESFELDDGFDFDGWLEPIEAGAGANGNNRPNPQPERPATQPERPSTDDGFGEDQFDNDTRPPVTQPEPTPQPQQPSVQYHTVSRGDTLFNISRRYSLSVEQLKALNNLSDNTILVGQRLRVK